METALAFEEVDMNWILVLILAMGLLVNCCATTTQEATPENFPALCRNIDTNHDGKITKEELLAAAKNKEEAASLYDLCDVQKKGHVSYDELSQSNRLQQVIRLTTPGY
jgi:Ca2+-binding EF-hand superfamily protein